MPSVLIELGYISNREEENYLKSENGQTSLASSIYNGFREFKREYDKKSYVFTSNGTVTASGSASSGAAGSSSVQAPAGEKEYRVQFLTSSRKYNNGASVFKGLAPVSVYHDGSVYKYTYGSTSSSNEIKKTLREVQKKFKDAFIVEFVGEQRVK